MSSLSELLEAVQKGTPNSDKVLMDYLVSEGLSEALAFNIINVALWSPRPASVTELYARAFFDTVDSSQGFEVQFFRDLQDKPESATNILSPRRLPSGIRFAPRRITLESPVLLDGALRVKVNQRVIFEGAASEVQSRGILGYPLLMLTEINDRDDIYARLMFDKPIEPQGLRVRFSIHGWATDRT